MINGPLSKEGAKRLARHLRVLADPARLQLLTLIASKDHGEARVRDMTAALGVSQPTVSHHISVLLSAGLLEKRRRGAIVYYRVTADPFEWLRVVLSEQQTTPAFVTKDAPDQGKGITPLPTVPFPSPVLEGRGEYSSPP